MPVARPNLLATANGRRWLFAALYLSEGAPVGFVWWAMPALLREQGWELASITTLTSLATLPWVLKFLVAPGIDASLARGVRLKHWIVGCQLLMAGALLPLVWLDWAAQPSWLIAIIAGHAVAAAIQDVAIDTLAIRVVPAAELGRVNGAMQAGMLLGRASVAAGSAVVASAFGTPGAAALCVIVLIVLPLTLLVFATVEPALAASRLKLGAVLQFLRSRVTIAAVAVALLVGAGFEFFGVSIGPRLVDLGGSDRTLALFYGVLAPGCLAVGALLGGVLADRVGAIRATAVSLVALTAVLCTVAAGDFLAWLLAPQLPLFSVAYLAIGFLTASSYALFMQLARGEYAATRFSVFMAMTNACEAWAGFVGGRFGGSHYGFTLLALSGVASLASLPLYVLAKDKKKVTSE
jgi:hypothetical protein